MKLPASPAHRLLALALLLLPAACGELSTGPHVHGGDDHAERTFSGSALTDAFVMVGEHYVSPLLESADGGTRVGFLVDVTADAAGVHLEARGFDASGAPGPWLPATFTWAEDTMRVGRVELGHIAYAAEVRVPASEAASLLALTYSLVVPGDAARDPGFDALASKPVPVDLAASSTRTQGLAIAGVHPRSAWGARATQCTSLNTTKTKISIHHSAGPSTPSPDYPGRLRGIQAYHMDSRGWCDVGYHFFVTKDGQQWEAREAKYLGSHVGNQNTNNLGIVTVGCWQTSGCSDFTPFTPPSDLVDAVGDLVGKNAAHYGITVSSSTVMGHRDNPGASTACPGDNLHAVLGEIRSIAAGGGSTPPPASTGKVQGVVWDLGITTDASQSQAMGARLEGATITASSGDTTTSRAEDAYWSFDLAPGSYTLTATLDGYAPASREVQVTAGGSLWASIGVAPVATSAQLTIFVHDAATLAPIEHATVEVTGADPAQTGANGEVVIAVNAGDLNVKAAAEGYETFEFMRAVAAGADDRAEVALTALAVDPIDEEPDPIDETPEGPGETPTGDDVKRVVLKPQTAGGDVAQGCVCVTGDSESGDPARGVALAGLLGLGLLLRRRRR